MKIKLPHNDFVQLIVKAKSWEFSHRGSDSQLWLDKKLEKYNPCSRLKFWKCIKIEVFAFSACNTDFFQVIYAEKIKKDKKS